MSKHDNGDKTFHTDSKQKRQRKMTAHKTVSSENETLLNFSQAEALISSDEDHASENSIFQEADYLPPLNNEIALLILARVPRSEYEKLCSINRSYRTLVRSGELYETRKSAGIKEPTVIMLASGETNWWSYDPASGTRRNLPLIPWDSCFSSLDKETFSVGTQLLVSGQETLGPTIWRYELALDKWSRGPLMLSPRCLFASASCGNVAFVAGGIATAGKKTILNTAESYDPVKRSWNCLPRMIRRRKLCSGCYMDSKFYVIGGQDEKGKNLTCAEFLDLGKKQWKFIPEMLKDVDNSSTRSPPLLAVVNNELYFLEASTNQLKMYMKKSNSWKEFGEAPVRADHRNGWGVAFKSIGDELLLIGSRGDNFASRGMTICACRPDPEASSLRWRVLESDGERWSSFIFNCSVMLA